MKKRIIAVVLIMLLLLSLGSCGKKSTKDIMKDKTNELVNEMANPSTLREFDISEESDGIYVTCLIRYSLDGYSLGAMKELYYDNFIESMFKEFPEMVSLLVELQGITDNHIYNCLYLRDGDAYKIVDETQIQ